MSAGAQWFTKQGPDGRWYKTQAANADEAKAKLSKVITPPAAKSSGPVGGYRGPVKETKPDQQIPKAYGFTPANVGKNAWEGAKGVVKGTYDLGATLLGKTDPSKPGGNVEQTLEKVFQPMREQQKKAKEDFNNNRLLQASGHFVAGLLPMLGPAAANVAEQAGTGDVGGATGQAAGMLLTGKAADAAVKTAGEFTDPALLRQRAGDLNTKVLKTAKEGVFNKTDVGLQVANEHIVSTLKELPSKIEQVRAAKNAKVEALAKYHDARGNTVDAEQGLTRPLQIMAQRLNTQGLLDTNTMRIVRNELDKLQNKVDMQTGRMVPRNLKSLTVRDAIELTKGLGKEINWDASTKAVVEPFRKTIRQVINDAIDKVDPEIGKTRAEESRLIEARDAADKQYTAMKNDKLATATGIFRSGAPAIATWLGLRALGLMTPVTALGSVIVIKTLAESALSRTARAALYAKAADILDRTTGAAPRATNAVSGPQVAPTGGKPTLPPITPQGAANASKGQPTASPAPSGLSAMPPPPAAASAPRQMTLPESATRARAGSGDYVRGQSVVKSNTKSTPVKEPTPAEVAPKNKAMLDRLDTLLERQAKPKSAMDNAAIQREIKEIKSLLSGEATGPAASKINKRIADRERLASKRSEAAATATPTQTGAGGEAVAQHASPEMRAIALDAGYKALAKYEGGDSMVVALKATAKAMQKVDPSYDEVERLTEALQVLKSLPPD